MNALQVIFVIIAAIAVVTGAVGSLIFIGAATRRIDPVTISFRRKRQHPQKMVIDPKTALCEPGICQCNDALAYHQGQGKCNVPGCPCMQFIPSTLTGSEMEEVTSANVTRLALESVNIRLDVEQKTKLLEAQMAERKLRNEIGSRQSVRAFGSYEEMGSSGQVDA